MLADGRWLVTGGLWTYGLDHDVALSSARTYSEADGQTSPPFLLQDTATAR